jgi:hypothetical protein
MVLIFSFWISEDYYYYYYKFRKIMTKLKIIYTTETTLEKLAMLIIINIAKRN